MPASTHWSDKLTSGRGKAYGVDIMVEKTSGRLTGFLGYGLLWSDRHFAALNHGRNFPSKYDNRHKINLSLKYALTPKIDINAGWTYMTGNRITLSLENYQYVHDTGFPPSMIPPYPDKEESQLNFYNAKNNVRLPAYHRLDLGINFYRPMSKGRMGIWNISIYNAYSRMNPIVIQKSTQRMTMEGQALTPRFRSLAIFPIIPSVSYTYKF